MTFHFKLLRFSLSIFKAQVQLKAMRQFFKFAAVVNNSNGIQNSKNRRPYIDLLRGFFIFVIIVDHLGFWPNGFEFITGKGALWVSAAEGFFIISGMMVGLIRGREWVKKGWKSATKKLWVRAAQLYALAVSLTLLYTALARWMGNVEPVKDGALANDSWPSVALQALSGQYVYGWSDFLIYYAVFLALAPIVLWSLSRGWWLAVAGVSLAVYSVGQGHFGLLWQPLFFGGLLAGFYLPKLESEWQKLNDGNQKLLRFSVLGIAFSTVVLSVLFVHFHIFPDWYKNTLQGLFERFYGFGVGRIILAPLWFIAIYYLFKRYQDKIIKFFGWLLFPLGKNALSAYTIHAMFVFVIHLFMTDSNNLLLNFGVTSITIICVWYIVETLQPYLTVLHQRLQRIVAA